MNRQRRYQTDPRRRGSVRALPISARLSGGHWRLPPFLVRIGPIALCLCSILLISLMAIFYLGQLGQGVTTNQQIQQLHSQQAILQRQDKDLVNTIAQERSPAYIAAQARKRGLVPADPRNVQVVPEP